jgi:hypothetical protein
MAPGDSGSNLEVKVKIDTSEVLDDILAFDNNEVIRDLEQRVDMIESTVAQPLGTPYYQMNLERIIDVLEEQLSQLTLGDVAGTTRANLMREFMIELDTLLTPFAGYETEAGVPLTFGQIGYALGGDEQKQTAHARAGTALSTVFTRLGGMVSGGGDIGLRGFKALLETLRGGVFKMADLHPVVGEVLERLGRKQGALAEAPMGGGKVDLLTQVINEFKTGKFDIGGARQVGGYGQADVLGRIRAFQEGKEIYEGQALFPEAPYKSLVDLLKPSERTGKPAIHPLRVLSLRKMTGPAAAEVKTISEITAMAIRGAPGLLREMETEEFVGQLGEFRQELLKTDVGLMQGLQADISKRIRDLGELPSPKQLYGWTLQYISHDKERAKQWGAFIGIDPEELEEAGAEFGALPYEKREKEDIDESTFKPIPTKFPRHKAWKKKKAQLDEIENVEKIKSLSSTREERRKLKTEKEQITIYDLLDEVVSQDPSLFEYVSEMFIPKGVRGKKKEQAFESLKKALDHPDIIHKHLKARDEEKKRLIKYRKEIEEMEEVESPLETAVPDLEEEEGDVMNWDSIEGQIKDRMISAGHTDSSATQFISTYISILRGGGHSHRETYDKLVKLMSYKNRYFHTMTKKAGFPKPKPTKKLAIAKEEPEPTSQVEAIEDTTLPDVEMKTLTARDRAKFKKVADDLKAAILMEESERIDLEEMGKGFGVDIEEEEPLIPRTVFRVPSTRGYFTESVSTRKAETKALESRIEEIKEIIQGLGGEREEEEEMLRGHMNYLRLIVNRLSEDQLVVADTIKILMAGITYSFGGS